MINKILMGIIKLIIGLVSVITVPIDNLITSTLPDLSSALSSVANFFNIALSSVGWCISLLGLSSNVISIIILYYTFKLTVPIVLYSIKLALSWYNKLKP